mmetsp:Transcript_9969/g.28620  ORF Transcript_9969/g.28620 Transcript_9969/m.28620 type:complete len:183 (-) Transcript_9969:2150-2698(-)
MGFGTPTFTSGFSTLGPSSALSAGRAVDKTSPPGLGTMTVLTPAELQQQQQLQQRRHSFAADGQAVAQHRAPLSGAEDVAVPLQARAEIPLMASHLIEKARTHWLKGHELITLFQLSAEGKFPLSPMAAQLPPGGCIFLYDRRAVRFFRLDGHNWRKKNDGKTVKETHEKLKVPMSLTRDRF